MLYLILATILLGIIIIFSALASRRADTNVVTLIINAASVAIPLIVVGAFAFKKSFTLTASSVVFAVICGLCLGLYGLMINKSISMLKVGIVAPTIFGGAILISTVMSYFIFKETLKGFELVGLLLVLAGISFIIYARAVA